MNHGTKAAGSFHQFCPLGFEINASNASDHYQGRDSQGGDLVIALRAATIGSGYRCSLGELMSKAVSVRTET